MPDAPYDRDIVTWPRHHADMTRRLARGDRVNAVGRDRVVEEIEDAMTAAAIRYPDRKL